MNMQMAQRKLSWIFVLFSLTLCTRTCEAFSAHKLQSRINHFSTNKPSRTCAFQKDFAFSPTISQTHVFMSSPSDEKDENHANHGLDADVISPWITYGVSIIGIFTSLVLLWSEYSIVTTRCGPSLLPDVVERSSYISIFILASGSNLSRIIFGSSLNNLLFGEDIYCERNSSIVLQKKVFGIMEAMVITSVFLTFAVLAYQCLNGDAFSPSAGMSGINVQWCKLVNE